MLRALLVRSLRLQKPPHRYAAVRSIVSFAYPSEDPDFPGVRCYPDQPKSLQGNRLTFHHTIDSILLRGDLDSASSRARQAITNARTSLADARSSCTALSDHIARAREACPAASPAASFWDTAYAELNEAVELIGQAASASETALKAGVGDTCFKAVEKLKAAEKATSKAVKLMPEESSYSNAQSKCKEALVFCRSAVSDLNRFPSVYTCNMIAAALQSAGRHQEAIETYTFFFEEMRLVGNAESLNILITTHLESGMVDTAFQIFEQAVANPSIPFRPSLRTYRALTSALVGAGRFREAMDFIWDMGFRGHGADSEMYHVVVRAHVAAGDMEKAMTVLSELRDYNVYNDGAVVATVMEGFFRMGMGERAMECYNTLIGRKLRLDSNTCNALLDALLKNGKSYEAHLLFEEMLARHSPFFEGVDITTCKILLDDCVKSGEFGKAVDIIKQMSRVHCVLDISCYHYLVMELCLNGLTNEAETLLIHMERNLVNPNADTYLLVSYGCLLEQKSGEALRYFESTSTGGRNCTNVDVALYNKVFDLLVEAGFSEHLAKAGMQKF